MLLFLYAQFFLVPLCFSLFILPLISSLQQMHFNNSTSFPESKTNFAKIQAIQTIDHLFAQPKINKTLTQPSLNQKIGEEIKFTYKQQGYFQEPDSILMKLDQSISSSSQWTQNQLQILVKMYAIIGSSWLEISGILQNKTQNRVKNKFYSALKKGANFLTEVGGSKNKFQKDLNFKIIKVFLDLSNQIKNWAKVKGFTINENSKIFKLRKSIVQFCLLEEQFTQENALDLLSELKQMTLHLKSYQFFKVKSRRNWKLTEVSLKKLFCFDKFVQQQDKISLLVEKMRRQPEDESLKQDLELDLELPSLSISFFGEIPNNEGLQEKMESNIGAQQSKIRRDSFLDFDFY